MADDASSYPGAVDNFTALAALMSSAPKHSDDHKKLRDAVRSIEIELGNNPSDSDTSVRTRFVRIEGEIDDLETVDNTIQADVAAIEDSLVRNRAVLTRSTNYNILTTATQLISWESISIEIGGNWWTSGVNVVCPAGADGLYTVKLETTWTSTFASGYHVNFDIDGGDNWVFGSSVGLIGSVMTMWGATAGEILNVYLHNPSGSTITADGMLLRVDKVAS